MSKKCLICDEEECICNECNHLEDCEQCQKWQSELKHDALVKQKEKMIKIVKTTEPCCYARVETCSEDCSKLWEEKREACKDCINWEIIKRIEKEL